MKLTKCYNSTFVVIIVSFLPLLRYCYSRNTAPFKKILLWQDLLLPRAGCISSAWAV